MKTINSIDLWTEQYPNQEECFFGAFLDGFDENDIPFDSYKVIKNCNCIIFTSDPSINISNKHMAIVFYKNNEPVRLTVINRETDIDKCIDMALNQSFNGEPLINTYKQHGITRRDVDMMQQPIIHDNNRQKEVDTGSCDRPSLLDNMLEGSYTQSDTNYGKKSEKPDFKFSPTTGIIYVLTTDEEKFAIAHSTAFVNSNHTRMIPLQCDSSLDISEIANSYLEDPNSTRLKH